MSTDRSKSLYRPPAPVPPSAGSLIWRILNSRKNDILHYIPEKAFSVFMGKAPGVSKRNVYLINDPNMIKHVMVDRVDDYPKSDLVTGSLMPLLGDSIFTVSGDKWKRQSRMIEQVFAKLRLKEVFATMQASINDYVEVLDQKVGGIINLDEEMAYVTADVIFRTMFSKPIADKDANTIFKEFTIYQESLPHMTGKVVFLAAAHTKTQIPKRGLNACAKIRDIIASIVDERLSGKVHEDDICQIIIECRDPETGEGFTREEIINQIAFFFLAGHETSASALTWAFLCLSQSPNDWESLRNEVIEHAGSGNIPYDKLSRMKFTSATFKEALRLYPPVAFITRHALKDDTMRGFNIKPDDLMIIAAWVVQRHREYWENPDHFDPSRFVNNRTGGAPNGAWIPFSVGQRVCTGAAFANAEASLILGTITRRYKLTAIAPNDIIPVSRLTLRPKDRLEMKLEFRD
ncbi:MAG: cytochrome P450 [Hyphomicrobiales bacterium]